jgi:peptidoglycan/xylan/chitin deacetylase (PgdA/CDA1 family)
MRTAKGTMDRLLGARPRTIAFPFGRADETTYRLVAELGYTHSFTTAQRTDCAALPALLPTSTAAQPANV